MKFKNYISENKIVSKIIKLKKGYLELTDDSTLHRAGNFVTITFPSGKKEAFRSPKEAANFIEKMGLKFK
jgi:hypothetical protein